MRRFCMSLGTQASSFFMSAEIRFSNVAQGWFPHKNILGMTKRRTIRSITRNDSHRGVKTRLEYSPNKVGQGSVRTGRQRGALQKATIGF